MAVIDVPGFFAAFKDHAAEHGFHIHDERHFVETYSLRQSWEVEMHPEEGCGGPVDLHVALDVDPRTLLAFEDAVLEEEEGNREREEEGGTAKEGYSFPLTFTWSVGKLTSPPDLLRLALDLAELGSPSFPLEVSATEVVPAPTDAPERRITVACYLKVPLAHIMEGGSSLCEELERAYKVSTYLLERAPSWMQAK
jgi:hypothetical protein